MWFAIALFAIAAACGVAGRKWGRYLYLHYGRHLLPRSMLTAKNRSPTPPLSPTKDDQSLEALLDESGEMHETVSEEEAHRKNKPIKHRKEIMNVAKEWQHFLVTELHLYRIFAQLSKY